MFHLEQIELAVCPNGYTLDGNCSPICLDRGRLLQAHESATRGKSCERKSVTQVGDARGAEAMADRAFLDAYEEVISVENQAWITQSTKSRGSPPRVALAYRWDRSPRRFT